jgi:hypothetical protein
MALKELGESLKEKVAGAADILTDLKESGKEKLLDYVNKLSEVLPVVAEAGYRLEEFEIDISIPPGVNLQFKKVQDVPRETIDRLLEQHKDQDILRNIVNALVAADEFHNKVTIGGYLFTTITVNLSIPPQVHLKFVRKE